MDKKKRLRLSCAKPTLPKLGIPSCRAGPANAWPQELAEICLGLGRLDGATNGFLIIFSDNPEIVVACMSFLAASASIRSPEMPRVRPLSMGHPKGSQPPRPPSAMIIFWEWEGTNLETSPVYLKVQLKVQLAFLWLVGLQSTSRLKPWRGIFRMFRSGLELLSISFQCHDIPPLN